MGSAFDGIMFLYLVLLVVLLSLVVCLYCIFGLWYCLSLLFLRFCGAVFVCSCCFRDRACFEVWCWLLERIVAVVLIRFDW